MLSRSYCLQFELARYFPLILSPFCNTFFTTRSLPRTAIEAGGVFRNPIVGEKNVAAKNPPSPLWQRGSGGFALAWKITSALKGHDELAGASVNGFFSYRFFYTRHGSDGQGFFLDFYQFLSLFLGGRFSLTLFEINPYNDRDKGRM